MVPTVMGLGSRGMCKYQAAKVNKDAEKILNCQNCFCSLCSHIICISTLKIASNLKPTLVFHVNKLVRENNSFGPGKSEKMNSAKE